MLDRYFEQSELVTTALCLLGKSHLYISNEELLAIRNTVAVLSTFEEVTREMSGEKFTSFSKVIPLVRGIQDWMNTSHDGETLDIYRTFPLGLELLKQMGRRFCSVESIFFLSAATLLDPRFKKIAFTNSSNAKTVEDQLVGLMTTRDPENCPSTSGSNNDAGVNTTSGPAQPRIRSVWSRFDEKVEKIAKTSAQTSTGPMIELRRYLEEAPISRCENPLSWWKEHALLFPKLHDLAKKFLCSPASSVPSERLFSKAGELVSHRRSSLKDKNINMILFLNKNLK